MQYDGDGNRVKKVAGSTATYYVGNYFKVTNGVSGKYYYPSMPQDMLWQTTRRHANERGRILSAQRPLGQHQRDEWRKRERAKLLRVWKYPQHNRNGADGFWIYGTAERCECGVDVLWRAVL